RSSSSSMAVLAVFGMWTGDSTWPARPSRLRGDGIFATLRGRKRPSRQRQRKVTGTPARPRHAWSLRDALTGRCAGWIGVACRDRRRDAPVQDGAAAGIEPAGGALVRAGDAVAGVHVVDRPAGDGRHAGPGRLAGPASQAHYAPC